MGYDVFFDFLGIIGVIGYLSSYAILQIKRDFADSITYSTLNFAAASLVAISLLKDFNLASMLIQISWILISSYGIYRCLKPKKIKM